MERAELTEIAADVASERAATIPAWWMWIALGGYGMAFGVYWWAVATFVATQRAAAGQFGDMFGGFNALASGLAMLGVIGALYLQRRQNEMQAEELRLQRIELAQTRQELAGQKQALERQNEQQLRTAEAAIMQRLMNEYDALRSDIALLRRLPQHGGIAALTDALYLLPNASPKNQEIHSYALEADAARHRISRFFVKVRRLTNAGYVSHRLVAISLERQAVEMFLNDIDPLDRVVSPHYRDIDRRYFQNLLMVYYREDEQVRPLPIPQPEPH